MCITGCRAKNCRSFSGFSDRLPYVKNAKSLTYRNIKKHLYQTKKNKQYIRGYWILQNQYKVSAIILWTWKINLTHLLTISSCCDTAPYHHFSQSAECETFSKKGVCYLKWFCLLIASDLVELQLNLQNECNKTTQPSRYSEPLSANIFFSIFVFFLALTLAWWQEYKFHIQGCFVCSVTVNDFVFLDEHYLKKERLNI